MGTRSRWAVLAGMSALASALLLSGCVGTLACSAVGYGYGGPAVIEFADALPTESMLAACFGARCEPASVERTDGRTWQVPQDVPFLAADSLGAGEERALRVVVTGADGAMSDEVHEIPVSMEPTGVFGECPGPFTFEPVLLDVS